MNNITFARFAGERTLAVASYLWQWDYGQILKIEGLELPTEYEVHFSNTSETGTTVTVLGDKNGVNIPDALLETGLPIFAFIYLHDLATDGETEYKIKIPVRKRPHPDRVEPTPEQTDLITQAITTLNAAVERTDASAEEAGEAAELAQQAAGSAAGYAQQAAESAQEARDAADGMDVIAQTAIGAKDQAVSAAQTATEAKTAAQEAAASVEEHVYDAEEYARVAAQSASYAGQSASAASQSAQSAAGSATSAGTSAQTATEKAQEASDSASGALASAGAASDSATQAETKATEAAQSASAASGSASSAAQSASDASDEADRAETAASSVSAAAAQIATNTADITDLKADFNQISEVIDSEIGQETIVTASPTLTDGYSIVTSGSNAGAVVTNATNSVSDEIDLTGAKEITFYYTNGNPYGNIFLYDAQNAFISTQGIPSSSNKATIAVPQNASYARYFCMTSRKGVVVEIKKEIQGTIYEEIETKQDKNLGVENAGKYLTVDSEGNIYPKALTTDANKTMYAPFTPVKPLIAEMMADFAWCSMIIPNAFTGKNVTITISGNAGETTVTASTISPDDLTLSDIWTTTWIGGVISPDGVNFTVCNFKYVSGDTIEVFPALSENISNGVLSTLMIDSGSSYVGLHLTENGYKAYMQNLFNKNPKHCEVGKYVARFRPEIDTVSPFVWYGGTIPAAAYRFITKNKALEWLNNPTTKFYGYQYSTQWQEHTTKSGAYWDVDLKGKSGYLEAYIFAICKTFNLPTDQELHVIVIIDGVEKLNETINNSICRRIVVDYENATNGRLEVYSNKWYKVDDAVYGFGFGRVTWWVNDLEYKSELFPKGAVIAQEFDSWGVFHDGASGKELERLQSEATGVTVPYTNKSKGDQTSAWGLAYYYENVFNYHPSIAIHDFVINDTNSVGNAGIPATIEGPDGKTYNNKLTSAQYAENMVLLGQLSISNGIQPIFMGACQHGSTNYYTFTNALIDAMSEEDS